MWSVVFATACVFVLLQVTTVNCSETERMRLHSYRSENILRMWPMSHHGDLIRTWTDAVHCPPGSFISAYKLDYSEQYGHLQHIALACAAPPSANHAGKFSGRETPVTVINVGVAGVNYTEKDLGSFKHSEDYAIGASYSTYKRKVRDQATGNNSIVDMEILFHRWSAMTAQQVKVDPPMTYWIQDLVSYAVCTKGFALCGMQAEVHKAAFFTNIQGHIRHLEFFCCYVCSPKQFRIPLTTVEATRRISILVGLEFAQDDDAEPSSGDVDDAFFLENIYSSISSTFDETFERDTESLPSYLSHKNLNPPAILEPLLKYEYSMPISIHIHHSSFGSEIEFPRGNALTAMTKTRDFLLSSLLSMKSGDFACYESKNLLQTASFHDSGSRSWDNSAILRTIRHGAVTNMLSRACRGRDRAAEIGCGWETDGPPAASLDVHMEEEIFVCDGVKPCSLYQVVEQCGVVRLHLPKFCVSWS